MSQYNPDIHHRRSIRLRGYNYSRQGFYFVTICAHEGHIIFGGITDGEMRLNDMCVIAHNCWNDIPSHFPNAVLREYIIMPNHIHGIIELVGARFIAPNSLAPGNPTPDNPAPNPPAPGNPAPNPRTPENPTPNNQTPGNHVPDTHAPNTQTSENHTPGSPAPNNRKHENQGAKNQGAINRAPTAEAGHLGGIIRWFKGRTTFECRKKQFVTLWQRNYYEHIIRNDDDYIRIAEYIANNPAKWNNGSFYREDTNL